MVLDPWNGSGTTTLAAQHLGFQSIGVDRNPVANVIARLRSDAGRCTGNIKRPPKPRARSTERFRRDPLAAWFDAEAIARLRDWHRVIKKLDADLYSIGMVALFRAVRSLTKPFEGSNPTWVKRAKEESSLIYLDHSEVDLAVEREIYFVSSRAADHPKYSAPITLVGGDSSSLPISDERIDVVLTSPPYLTRIDYAVAYTRELAILGIDISSDRRLRSGLMGTTLIRREDSLDLDSLGNAGKSLLERIAQHDSKASSGYYLKQARQYLDDLTAGFDQLSRVCKRKATVHLVVQDSFYKDVPVPLAEICIEESRARGWDLEFQERFEVRRSLTTLNTAARAYKKGDVEESVITLRRG
ncbi:site-specific DNA-methyltransferase [Streptomyces sp. NBC_01728]|uniref:hypothetical protein n=1 Tax=unclassified Streptomyces TaxID=2593676 RepID=UPI002254D09E|nr:MULTISPECIES: hypothetical protein [unclassified Streptomyces]MCX4456795.1 site-specific DNA-methyltransferase [Streptomyces sp. NBC_01719]MCX4496154.1 site-specific DNA-methyltransferase [Streptomyces sp. NBC_01728]